MDGEQATIDYEKNWLFNIVENHGRLIKILGANWTYISFNFTHSVYIDLCKFIEKKHVNFCTKASYRTISSSQKLGMGTCMLHIM
jgi:hypothetical protein